MFAYSIDPYKGNGSPARPTGTVLGAWAELVPPSVLPGKRIFYVTLPAELLVAPLPGKANSRDLFTMASGDDDDGITVERHINAKRVIPSAKLSGDNDCNVDSNATV